MENDKNTLASHVLLRAIKFLDKKGTEASEVAFIDTIYTYSRFWEGQDLGEYTKLRQIIDELVNIGHDRKTLVIKTCLIIIWADLMGLVDKTGVRGEQPFPIPEDILHESIKVYNSILLIIEENM